MSARPMGVPSAIPGRQRLHQSWCGERSPWRVRTSLSPIQASGAGSGAPSAPVGLATETDYACSSEWVKGTSAAQFGEHGEGWGVPADRHLDLDRRPA
jgi:hypothetical protein